MEASAVPRLAPVGVAGIVSPKLLRLASDDRLIALIRTGNRAAFEAAYNRHHRSILSFCRHMLGSKEEAEDAVQHTFLAAYNDLVSSDKPIHLRAWLFTIARNRCYSTLRARREHPAADLAEPATEGLATQVQRRQDLRDLVGDLGRLPDDQRAALVLAEMDALSHEQIGAVLGVPREKVKALVFQARESLVASRDARETSCVEIREELATLHGGGLRRANLRRHLRECAGCSEYRKEIERQRRRLGLILPVAPTIALKAGVIGIALGGTAGVGAAGGGLLAGSALKGFTAKGLIAAALAGVGTTGTIVAVRGFDLAPVLPRHQAGAHRSAGASGPSASASGRGSGHVSAARSTRSPARSVAAATPPPPVTGLSGSGYSIARAIPGVQVPVPSAAPVLQLGSGRRTASGRTIPVKPTVAPAIVVATQQVARTTGPVTSGGIGRPFVPAITSGAKTPAVAAAGRLGGWAVAGGQASSRTLNAHASVSVRSSVDRNRGSAAAPRNGYGVRRASISTSTGQAVGRGTSPGGDSRGSDA
jgi:RNA polymerase sigma factor (sigma-70 family)